MKIDMRIFDWVTLAEAVAMPKKIKTLFNFSALEAKALLVPVGFLARMETMRSKSQKQATLCNPMFIRKPTLSSILHRLKFYAVANYDDTRVLKDV